MNMALHPGGGILLTANHDAGSLAVLEPGEAVRYPPASASRHFLSSEAAMTDWNKAAREADYTVPDFKFAEGTTLDVRLHYRTLGTLSPDGYHMSFVGFSGRNRRQIDIRFKSKTVCNWTLI
jgi:hypothetical protein